VNDVRLDRRSLALFLGGWFALWALRATVLYDAIDATIEPEWVRGVYSNVVKLALWVGLALAYERVVGCEARPLERWRVTTRVEPRGLAVGGLPCVAFLALVLARVVHAGIDGSKLGPAVLAHAISPATEEIFFRGFLLARVLELVPGARGHALVALLFVAVHWPHWLWTHKPAGELLEASGAIFLLALLLGNLAARCGSIWPGYLVHFANNIIVSLAK